LENCAVRRLFCRWDTTEQFGGWEGRQKSGIIIQKKLETPKEKKQKIGGDKKKS